MYRKAMKPRIDRAVFRNTAVQQKTVNLGSRVMRGGIRF